MCATLCDGNRAERLKLPSRFSILYVYFVSLFEPCAPLASTKLPSTPSTRPCARSTLCFFVLSHNHAAAHHPFPHDTHQVTNNLSRSAMFLTSTTDSQRSSGSLFVPCVTLPCTNTSVDPSRILARAQLLIFLPSLKPIHSPLTLANSNTIVRSAIFFSLPPACTLPASLGTGVTGGTCTAGGLLAYGTTCNVACAAGYDPRTPVGTTTYNCSSSGTVLTANATLVCLPRMYLETLISAIPHTRCLPILCGMDAAMNIHPQARGA